MAASNKGLVVTFVALIAVVGCVIGIVVTVSSGNEQGGNNLGSKSPTVSKGMKAVSVICHPTRYKEACERSLGPVAKNGSSNPKDYILAAIRSTKQEMIKSLDAAVNIKSGDYDSKMTAQGVEECKKLLRYASEDLESAVEMVSKSEVKTVHERVRDVQNWLTAVYSFQSQCKGFLKNSKYKSKITEAMVNSTELTHNALVITAEIFELVKLLNIDQVNFDVSGFLNSRKLLQAREVGHAHSIGVDLDYEEDNFEIINKRRLLEAHDIKDGDEYPRWVPKADRMLLGEPGVTNVTNNTGIIPDVVVAQDGSGQFKTITEAIAAYPKAPLPPGKRFIIYVKAGVYDEQPHVPREAVNMFIYGDGPSHTIITGMRNFKLMGLITPNTSTFSVEGRGFMAKSMTFRNTAGPDGEQAVALRVLADNTVIQNCRIEGYQDTLLYQNYRQFYRNCVITGTIDFIFGEGLALIQNSIIVVRKPSPLQNNLVIAADGKEMEYEVVGLVLQNCKLMIEKELFPEKHRYNIFLGRPWMKFATQAIIESDLGDFIHPEGYVTWPTAPNELTCNFIEYGNRGLSANTEKRVKWSTLHILKNATEALPFTAERFIDGGEWLKDTGVPFYLGLKEQTLSSSSSSSSSS